MNKFEVEDPGIVTVSILVAMTVLFIPVWWVWQFARRFRRVTLRERLWKQVLH